MSCESWRRTAQELAEDSGQRWATWSTDWEYGELWCWSYHSTTTAVSSWSRWKTTTLEKKRSRNGRTRRWEDSLCRNENEPGVIRGLKQGGGGWENIMWGLRLRGLGRRERGLEATRINRDIHTSAISVTRKGKEKWGLRASHALARSWWWRLNWEYGLRNLWDVAEDWARVLVGTRMGTWGWDG